MARAYYERTKQEEELGVSSDARHVKLFRLPNTYVVMDLETTGLDPTTDGILEIGAVKVVDGVVCDEFHTMVNTEARMRAAARKVNGITREMLKGAPRTAEAVTTFLEYAEELPLVGHNVKRFDKPFLENAAMTHLGCVVENEWVDTIELAKSVFGYRMSLKKMCELLNVTNEEAHRALSDVRATNECYQGMRALVAQVSTDSRDLPDPSPNGNLAGEVVCFTGNPYDPSRRQIMEATLAHGGTISNGMTLKVTILVNLDDAETVKVKRAKEYSERTARLLAWKPPQGKQTALKGVMRQRTYCPCTSMRSMRRPQKTPNEKATMSPSL